MIRGVVFGLIITAPFWFILTAIPFLAVGDGGGLSLIGVLLITAAILWVIAFYPPLLDAIEDAS